MAAYIQTIEDSNGNEIYPVTKINAVYDDKGNTLDTREFRLDGFSILDAEYAIQDDRIKNNSIVDVYFKDPTYDINPAYELTDGQFKIILEQIPATAIEVVAVVVRNL